MQRELNPFLCCFCILLSAFSHQSAKETFLAGVSLVKFRGCKIAHGNCLAKTQVVRMCWTFLPPDHIVGSALVNGLVLTCSIPVVNRNGLGNGIDKYG